MDERLEIEISANLKQARDDIDGFAKRIKSDRAIELSVKIAGINEALRTAKENLKEARDRGDMQLTVEIGANIERLSQQLTQARRELRNFTRTGDEGVSVLGNLFMGVNRNIDATRQTLQKLGRGSAEIDALKAEIEGVGKAFAAGKISMEEFRSSFAQTNQRIEELGKNAGEAVQTLDATRKKMEQTRAELSKLGGAKADLGGIRQQVDAIKDEFEAGRISVAEFRDELAKVNGRMDQLVVAAKGLGGRVGSALTTAVQGFVAFQVIDRTRAALAAAGRDAISFESAFTGVRKTLDGSEEDFARIES